MRLFDQSLKGIGLRKKGQRTSLTLFQKSYASPNPFTLFKNYCDSFLIPGFFKFQLIACSISNSGGAALRGVSARPIRAAFALSQHNLLRGRTEGRDRRQYSFQLRMRLDENKNKEPITFKTHLKWQKI